MPRFQSTTLKSIAKIVGCSDSTVSRVLNGKAREFRISQETEDAVVRAAKEHNYLPNPQAASLRTRATRTIGLVIPDISNPFFAGIGRNVERECRKLGYAVFLVDTEENTTIEQESVRLLQMRSIDGLIIAPVGQSARHLQELYDAGLPIVIIDRCLEKTNVPYVTSDNYRGAREAVAFLIQKGHRRIACVQGLNHTSPNNDRVLGYRDALQEAGIAVDERLIVGDSFGEENGYLETKLLLKLPERPTALFTLSNLISLGALRAVLEERLHIPQDISIIAFDDQPYLGYLVTPLTTVAQQTVEMGRMAMKMLYTQIKTKEKLKTPGVLLPTHLIHRQSVAERPASSALKSLFESRIAPV